MTWLTSFHITVLQPWIQSHPVVTTLCVLIVLYNIYTWLYPDPLMKLPVPRGGQLLGGHALIVIDAARSPWLHERYARDLGRNVRLRGLHPWETRLLPLDPVTVAHVLKNPTIYEKPLQSRKFIEKLIGCGMLASEGHVHKRQRRVATPAFSVQNMRALVPLVFNKGEELKDRWMGLIQEQAIDNSQKNPTGIRLDVCHWLSRATFDVIGLAGFDYHFNALQSQDNELFNAYKNMFEVAVSQSGTFRAAINAFFPLYERLFPDEATHAVRNGQKIIYREAKRIIEEKKQKIKEAEYNGKTYEGRDLLSLLLKSNAATDLTPEQRISDEDILDNINTFMFAGSDTTSLAVTWTLLLLAKHPPIQDQLRAELCGMARPANLGDEAILAHYQELAVSPFLDKVCRESLRIMPPVHSSLRTATQDDVLPVSKGGEDIHIRKGTLVHVPIEAMNLDREIWGKDGWSFIPDRWDNLPESVASLPGLYANTLTFSAGPRSCIGQRFSLIELKTFLYVLITNFVFSETNEKVVKANVVLTRPYISQKFKEGSQCPMIVTPYVPAEAT